VAEIAILVRSARFRANPDLRARIEQMTHAVLAHVEETQAGDGHFPGGQGARTSAGQSLTLLLTQDAELRRLNRMFRGIDAPTNVLAFPAAPVQAASGMLGDIALGFETLAAEARAMGISLEAHFSHLVVHGILHLLGFDHHTDAEAHLMETAERHILEGLGLPDPYAEAAEEPAASLGVSA